MTNSCIKMIHLISHQDLIPCSKTAGFTSLLTS
jgi:hypothetical protein